jgi:hypothetical protein
MKNACLDIVLAELELHGIKPELRHGGKHLRLFWMHEGRKLNTTVPASSSDWRARYAARAQVRRKLSGVAR